MEIERKYLLSKLPNGLKDGTRIRQGYLTTGKREVRVRQKGDKFYITYKKGEGFIRDEAEFKIPKIIFKILWPFTANKRIEKTRYELTSPDNHTWEVDKYHGNLAGLVVAEVELLSESVAIVIPSEIEKVLVRDVTEDGAYKNKSLAVYGLSRNRSL